MLSHLFYYQLALLAILWLFVMLPLTGPRRSATTTTAPATPIKPKRTRSHEPKAFAGLTHKPHCALCERSTARVFEVDPNTVLHWLVEAAEHLRTFSAYFLCDLHLEQLQLDELYAVLRDLKAGEISDAEAIKRLELSPDWVWTAMDLTSKLLVTDHVWKLKE